MNAIDPVLLRAELVYDPATGHFYRPGRLDKPAGAVDSKGYVRIYYRGKSYAAHRLAWLFVTGGAPTGVIDHINRDRRDNRVYNLRDVSSSENNMNRVKVYPCGERNRNPAHNVSRYVLKSGEERFCVNFSYKGRSCYLGRFSTLADAVHARDAAFAKLTAEHTR